MDTNSSKKELSKFIKYFLFNCVIVVVAVLFVYLFYYGIRINGHPLFIFFNKYYSQTISAGIESFFRNLGNGNLLLMLLSTVVEIVLFFGIALIVFLIVPIFILSLMREFYIKFVVLRKNSWFNYNYQLENEKNIPHKQRESGDEWYRKKQEKQNQHKKENSSSNNYSSSYYQQTQTNSNDFQNDTTENAAPVNNLDNITLEKALTIFLFDDTNFTKTQLKKRRNQLIRTLHPDKEINDSTATRDAKIINLCYSLLSEYAKEG